MTLIVISNQFRILPLHTELRLRHRSVNQLMHILSDLRRVFHSPSCQSKEKESYLKKTYQQRHHQTTLKYRTRLENNHI